MVAYNQFNKNAIIHESIYIILVLLGCANHIRNRKSRTISLAQKQRAENVCSKPYVGLMHGDVVYFFRRGISEASCHLLERDSLLPSLTGLQRENLSWSPFQCMHLGFKVSE